MNMNPTPQAVPGPAPLPAPDLGSCVQGIRQSIIDWAESHPTLGRLADPITVHILALLQTLADLFALFAAGKLAPRTPAVAPVRRAATPRGGRIAARPQCARAPWAPMPLIGDPCAPSRRHGGETPACAPARPGRDHAPSLRAPSCSPPAFLQIGALAEVPNHACFVTITKLNTSCLTLPRPPHPRRARPATLPRRNAAPGGT